MEGNWWINEAWWLNEWMARWPHLVFVWCKKESWCGLSGKKRTLRESSGVVGSRPTPVVDDLIYFCFDALEFDWIDVAIWQRCLLKFNFYFFNFFKKEMYWNSEKMATLLILNFKIKLNFQTLCCDMENWQRRSTRFI